MGAFSLIVVINLLNSVMSRQIRTYIISEIRKQLALISFNRPAQLNALSVPLIEEVLLELSLLRKFENTLSAILIKGEGGKAFCAGGDIKCLMQAFKEKNLELINTQTRGEYSLIHRLHSNTIPTIALVNGICMGTGGGVLCNSQFSVVTEKAVFAMPETAIGIVPDAGLAPVFRNMTSNLGMYLGLTGARLKGSCIHKAGLSDYFVTSDKIDELESALASAEQSPQSILEDFHHQSTTKQNPFSLEEHLSTIDSCFGRENVKGCIETLPETDFGLKTRATLEDMSPIGLKATFQHIKRPYKSLLECLTMDYRLAYRLCRSHDFIEGVSALLIEKRKPVWKPANLDDISDNQVDDLFKELPDDVEDFVPLTQK